MLNLRVGFESHEARAIRRESTMPGMVAQPATPFNPAFLARRSGLILEDIE